MTHSSSSSNKSTHPTAGSSAGQSPLAFEITRGRTESPLRPISRDRFLIGSGERCDLRLGGSDVPAIHSVVYIDGSDIWLETVADSPELRVNGRLTRSAALEPGDELEIGSFCLTLHRVKASEPAATPRLRAASVEELLAEEEDFAQPDLESLSAGELVDLIEHEEALVEEFEARRQMGAQALLDVLKQRSGEPQSDNAPIANDHRPEPREILRELESAILSLNEFAQDFQRRAGRLNQRDAQRTANSLLDFQQQIVSRLDGVLEKIAQIDQAERQQAPRRDVA